MPQLNMEMDSFQSFDDFTMFDDSFPELNVNEISKLIDGLTAAQIREVREYERRNKNRETLIEQFDRKLKAASA